MTIPIRGRAGLAILAIGTAAIAACSGSSSAWTPAVALPGAAGATLNGITTGTTSSSPFVAVGTVPASGEVEHAAVWTSPDGTTWSQAPDTADFGQAQMLAVGVGSLGYMAVGARCSTGECGSNAIWTSSDGTTWTRTDGIPTVAGVNADSRTVIAGGSAGSSAARPSTRVLEPAGDLDVERRVGLDPWDAPRRGRSGVRHAQEDGVVTELATRADRIVAVGSLETSGGHRAAVWTSSDGTSWTPVDEDPSFAEALMTAVAAGGPGFVAVGKNGDGAAVWTSTDGTTWQADASGPGFAGAQMTAIAASGGRLEARRLERDRRGQLDLVGREGLVAGRPQPRTWRVRRHLGVAVGSTVDAAVGRRPAPGRPGRSPDEGREPHRGSRPRQRVNCRSSRADGRFCGPSGALERRR